MAASSSCCPQSPTSPTRSVRASAREVAGELGVKLQVQQFLDDWHYNAMHSHVAKSWDRRKALRAALDLLEINGVEFPEGAKEKCLEADDEAIVECIFSSMPLSVQEHFEELSKQLQSALSRVSHARRALEADNQEAFKSMCEVDDEMGISRKVLRSAVLRAANEVARTIDTHGSWRKRTEDRIVRLSQAADDAERARQQWMATETQLAEFGSAQSKKARSCLMSLAGSQNEAVLHTAFATWHGVLMKAKAQQNVRMKWEAEIAEAEERLFKLKERQLDNVRASLKRQAMDVTSVLLRESFREWVLLWQEAKNDCITADQLKEVRKRMEEAEHSRRANMTKVVARMCADSVMGPLHASFVAWTQALEDAKQDRALAGEVRRVERQLEEHLATHKSGATSVFERLGACSHEGLLHMAMSAWTQQLEEDRKTRHMEKALDDVGSRLNWLKDRQHVNACKAQSRINRQVEHFICMRILNTWLLATKAERVMRHFAKKIDAKRKQLSGVQTLFKTVAQQLDQGIDDSEETSRITNIKPIPRKAAPRASKRSSRGEHPEPAMQNLPPLQKGKGTFSLPDIRQRPMWEEESVIRRER